MRRLAIIGIIIGSVIGYILSKKYIDEVNEKIKLEEELRQIKNTHYE